MSIWPTRLRRGVSSILRRLVDMVCPPGCVFCGLDCIPEKVDSPSFCPQCIHRFLATTEVAVAATADSSRSQSPQPLYDRAVVLGEYKDELRQAVLQMKEEVSGLVAMSMARLFFHIRYDELMAKPIDVLVPVPTHFGRRWFRGTDGVRFLTTELASLLSKPMATGQIYRHRATRKQHTLVPEKRVLNVHGAFRLRRSAAARLHGKHVLLVDDILTTGATVNEICRVLHSVGVVSITVAAVCHAKRQTEGECGKWNVKSGKKTEPAALARDNGRR